MARNAAFTAMEIGALAGMYPGRLTAGLGHGISAWMRQVGLAPRSPLAALGESLQAVHALLRGREVTMRGDYVRLENVRLDHPPATPPPLLAGVRGLKSLALAGRQADGVVLAWPSTPAYVAHAWATVSEAWEAAGRPGRPYLVACSPVGTGPDGPEARARLRPIVAAERAAPWARAHLEAVGLEGPVARLVASSGSQAERAERVPDEWIDELATTGDPRTCASKVRQLYHAGAGSVVFSDVGNDPQGLRDMLRHVRAGLAGGRSDTVA